MCDNKDYVQNLTIILENKYHWEKFIKRNETVAQQMIFQLVSSIFSIEYVVRCQDYDNTYSLLDTQRKLYLEVDRVATQYATLPIDFHLILSSYTVYFQDNYTHHRIDQRIWYTSYSEQSQIFLMKNITSNQKLRVILPGSHRLGG